MIMSINAHVVDHHMDGIPSGCILFASRAQASPLLPPQEQLPPPVPDHRVEWGWTRGRSQKQAPQWQRQAPQWEGAPGSRQQAPQWAPRPPQRRRSRQQQVSRLSGCLGVVPLSFIDFKPFPFLLRSEQHWDLFLSPFVSALCMSVLGDCVATREVAFRKPSQYCPAYCPPSASIAYKFDNDKIKVSVMLKIPTHRCL